MNASWESRKDCIYNSCLYFNGLSDYIDCGNKIDFNGKNRISFSAWIKLDSLNVQRNILEGILVGLMRKEH
jgi:hypothetical protein